MSSVVSVTPSWQTLQASSLKRWIKNERKRKRRVHCHAEAAGKRRKRKRRVPSRSGSYRKTVEMGHCQSPDDSCTTSSKSSSGPASSSPSVPCSMDTSWLLPGSEEEKYQLVSVKSDFVVCNFDFSMLATDGRMLPGSGLRKRRFRNISHSHRHALQQQATTVRGITVQTYPHFFTASQKNGEAWRRHRAG